MTQNIQMFGTYKVTTTKAVIQTPAQSTEAAIEIVMASELCPRSAILSVTNSNQPIKF